MNEPQVAVVMGSDSDWPVMSEAVKACAEFGVACHQDVVSAHRMPDEMLQFGRGAADRGLRVIIAGAGGAAHLPGMTAAHTALPVLGVPVESRALGGLDSLLSIVQMPAGVPVGTLAIGKAGAVNAALLAASILGLKHPEILKRLKAYRKAQTEAVLAHPDPREEA